MTKSVYFMTLVLMSVLTEQGVDNLEHHEVLASGPNAELRSAPDERECQEAKSRIPDATSNASETMKITAPDRKFEALVRNDGTFELRDMSTMKTLFRGYHHGQFSEKQLSSSQQLITISRHGRARVHESSTGILVHEFPPVVKQAWFESRFIVLLTDNWTAIFNQKDYAQLSRRFSTKGKGDALTGVMISEDGEYMALVQSNDSWIVEIETGRSLVPLGSHTPTRATFERIVLSLRGQNGQNNGGLVESSIGVLQAN